MEERVSAENRRNSKSLSGRTNVALVLLCDLLVILILTSHYPFRIESAVAESASYVFKYLSLIYKYGLFAKPDEGFSTTIAEIETADGKRERIVVVPFSSTPAPKRPPLARWRTLFDENVPTYPNLGERGQLLLQDVTLYLVRKFEKSGRKVQSIELFVVEKRAPLPHSPSADSPVDGSAGSPSDGSLFPTGASPAGVEERKRSIYKWRP